MRFILFAILLLAPSSLLAGIALKQLDKGIPLPVYIVSNPYEKNRFYVLESRGRVLIYENDKFTGKTLLDIRSKVGGNGEMGLTNLVFHPDYKRNKRFFVNYVKKKKGKAFQRVAEYRLGGGKEKIILEVEHPDLDHNGGQLFFDKKGYLYVVTGDGSSIHEVSKGLAHSKTSLLGKVLRLDIDKGTPYAIPKDNPFVGVSGVRPEIYAYGLRHAWRVSYDKQTETILAGDNGYLSYEEINWILPGRDYGWSTLEGVHCFDPAKKCDPKGLEPPVHIYDHSIGGSIIGGHIYRGKGVPELAGKYIFGDFATGRVWSLALDHKRKKAVGKRKRIARGKGLITSFGVDSRGEILVVTFDGRLYRLVKKT